MLLGLYTSACIFGDVMENKYFENLGNAYLAHFARRLSDVIIEQATTILAEAGLITPPTAISSMFYLAEKQDATVATLAEALGVSHQMATQRINALEKLKLVQRVSNAQDRRAKNIALTALGQREVQTLKPITAELKLAFDDLEKEMDCPLTNVIRGAELALIAKPLKARVNR